MKEYQLGSIRFTDKGISIRRTWLREHIAAIIITVFLTMLVASLADWMAR